MSTSEIEKLKQQRDELVEALKAISSLEERADASVVMVDSPHIKAMRSMSKIAKQALSKAEAV